MASAGKEPAIGATIEIGPPKRGPDDADRGFAKQEPDAEDDESRGGDHENRGDRADRAAREAGEEVVEAPGDRSHQAEQG